MRRLEAKKREIDVRLSKDKKNGFIPSQLVKDFIEMVAQDNAGLLFEELSKALRDLSNEQARPLREEIERIKREELLPDEETLKRIGA